MIKCKVTKKIMQEPGTVMGFSIGQVIMLIVGCVATIGTLLLLWLVLKINIDIIMWVVFLELVLFIGLGVVRIQGLTVLQFIASNPTKSDRLTVKEYSVMSIIDNLFNGWAKRMCRLVMINELLCQNRRRIQYHFMKCTIMGCFLPEQTHLH